MVRDGADDNPQGSLKVREEERPGDGSLTVELVGRLDIETTGRFDQGIRQAIGRGPERIVLDLRRVTHLDSSGVRALVLAQRAASAADLEVLLVPGASHVRRILQTTGVAAHFRVLDDPAEVDP
jgi:anti-sigma B factor antagonist